jgi:hypothetical protein
MQHLAALRRIARRISRHSSTVETGRDFIETSANSPFCQPDGAPISLRGVRQALEIGRVNGPGEPGDRSGIPV